VEQRGAIKRIFERSFGKILLGVLAGATLLGSFVYLGPLLSIAAFLFFAFAIPIYLGWKHAGQLALMGLIVMLVVAPIAATYEAATLRTPSPLANSSPLAPYGNGGSVLQGGTVTPFTGDAGGVYNFSVTVHPEFVPSNTTGLLWIELLVSTCPGANNSSSPLCGSGFPFVLVNQSVPANATAPYVVYFPETLNGTNLWWFQFATAYEQANGTGLTWILLDPGNAYGAVQGPVSGDFLSTVVLVLPLLYTWVFLYPGIVFFIAVLIYYLFKRREAARKAQMRLPEPSASPTTDGGPATGAPSGAPRVASTERHCPKCDAVIYPKETRCWRCGTDLPPEGAPAADAPLPSGEAPPKTSN